VVFVLSGTFDLRAMANANREHARLLGQAAEKKKLEREAQIEQAIAAASGKNLGEETFKTVCMQCHRMNEKLVGPPLRPCCPSTTAVARRSSQSDQAESAIRHANPGCPGAIDAVAAVLNIAAAAPPAPGRPTRRR
jgi:cytochrome c551/c552